MIMYDDQWEEPFHLANALLGLHRLDEAVSVLATARDAAIGASDPSLAAFYSNVLGSFYAARGEHQNALEAYAEAERQLPNEPAYKLRTARFHFEVSGMLEDALRKIEEVILAIGGDNPLLLEVRDLLQRIVAAGEDAGNQQVVNDAKVMQARIT